MTRSNPRRVVVGALAALALLAGSFVFCPCVAPGETGHACCETTAWRAGGATCCGAADETPDAVAPSSNDDGFVATTLVTNEAVSATVRAAVSSLPTSSSVSPPRTVLRI